MACATKTVPTLPFISQVPRSQVSLSNANGIARNLPSMLPTWTDNYSTISVSQIPGGITNLIFRATHQFATPSTVLIRVFGAEGVFTTEQRHLENSIFEQLGRAGHAPPLLALFANGRVETFLPARPLHLPEMVSPVVMHGVATAMARLHTFRPCDADDDPHPAVWAQITMWAHEAARLADSGQLSAFDRGVPACTAALHECRKRIEEEAGDSLVVFCHNDLLAGNILIDADKQVHLVDFEYAGWNYRGFDIANFFCEAMGGTTDGIVQSERYPTLAMRTAFCRAYLVESGGSRPTEASVRELVQEAERFAAVAHLYWGFWALVQSAGDTVDFPYVQFAEQRFQLYFSRDKCRSSCCATKSDMYKG